MNLKFCDQGETIITFVKLTVAIEKNTFYLIAVLPYEVWWKVLGFEKFQFKNGMKNMVHRLRDTVNCFLKKVMYTQIQKYSGFYSFTTLKCGPKTIFYKHMWGDCEIRDGGKEGVA